GIHPDAASSALRRPLRDQSAGYGAGLDPFGPVLATQDGRGAARYGASVQARVPVARRLQRGQRSCTGELWAPVTGGWDAGSGECSGAADGGTASAEVGGAVLTLSTAILTMAGSSRSLTYNLPCSGCAMRSTGAVKPSGTRVAWLKSASTETESTRNRSLPLSRHAPSGSAGQSTPVNFGKRTRVASGVHSPATPSTMRLNRSGPYADTPSAFAGATVATATFRPLR